MQPSLSKKFRGTESSVAFAQPTDDVCPGNRETLIENALASLAADERHPRPAARRMLTRSGSCASVSTTTRVVRPICDAAGKLAQRPERAHPRNGRYHLFYRTTPPDRFTTRFTGATPSATTSSTGRTAPSRSRPRPTGRTGMAAGPAVRSTTLAFRPCCTRAAATCASPQYGTRWERTASEGVRIARHYRGATGRSGSAPHRGREA